MSKLRRGKDKVSKASATSHEEDMRGRSITPTTHQFRDLFKDKDDMEHDMKTAFDPTDDMSDAIFYRDVYSHKTWGWGKLSVVHLGINTSNKAISSDLLTHNTKQAVKIATLSGITNASAATQYPPFAKAIILTKYESHLMDLASHYLQGEKIVIVDTFPRVLKAVKGGVGLGDIEVSSSGSFSTHAAILYKNMQGDILIIDPSNPKFSGHLQHAGVNIKASNNSSDLHKIYSPAPGSNPGPEGNKYRDCVDISVKLAALLSLDSTNYTSHDEVMGSKAVSMVSNTLAITGLLTNNPSVNNPLRIKQVSHLTKMKVINDKLLAQKDNYDKVTKDLDIQRKAAIEAAEQQYAAGLIQLKADHKAEVAVLVGEVAIDTELEGNYA